MADTSNLTQFLTDVAGAIKEKTGKTDKIPAANFDAEILSIKTGGSGDVKLFETKEEMQSDTTAKEGDLAVVYRIEIQNVTVDSKFQTATFPETVVLNSAITDYAEFSYIAVDSSVTFGCTGSLDSSSFRMDCYTDSGEIRIQYTSEDGITYTRTDTTGNPVDFGTEIYYERAEMWNDAIGKFIEVGSTSFNGIYKYSGTAWELAPTDLTTVADDVYLTKFYGANGIEQGTLQNIENLSKDNINKRVKLWNIFNSGMVCPSDVSAMFKDCTNLQTIPLLDTSKVTNMFNMFHGCINLTTIPQLDTNSVKSMIHMFNGCTNLTTIPLLNTSSVTKMQFMFSGCTSLTEIPLLNTGKVTKMQSMFIGCTSLSDESLNNILAMCANATSYTSTKTLKYIGLTSDQATKCTTLSNYSAFTSAGWTTGY